MSRMPSPNEQPADARSQSRLAAWMSVIAIYLAASLVQILVYGAGASHSEVSATTDTAPSWASELFYLVEVLAWLLGPATIATWIAVRKLRFWKDMGTERMTVTTALALLLLPALSIYLGVVVSFNTWGT